MTPGGLVLVIMNPCMVLAPPRAHKPQTLSQQSQDLKSVKCLVTNIVTKNS